MLLVIRVKILDHYNHCRQFQTVLTEITDRSRAARVGEVFKRANCKEVFVNSPATEGVQMFL